MDDNGFTCPMCDGKGTYHDLTVTKLNGEFPVIICDFCGGSGVIVVDERDLELMNDESDHVENV